MAEVTKEQIYQILLEISADCDAILKRDVRETKAMIDQFEGTFKGAPISVRDSRPKTDD